MQLLNIARLCAGVFILALLSACSTPQTTALLKTRPAGLPVRMELPEVAYFPQEENQCGPAALAMVLANSGRNDIQPAHLTDELYIPDRKGSLQVEMLAAARRHGMLAYQLNPNLDDVLAEVAAGHPVIVLQNLSLEWFPLWHYAVVIGYDLDKREVILRSGAERRQILALTTFEHTWARSKYWAMLALPTDTVPKTAKPEKFLQSLQALSHSRPELNLHPAYQAAMLRWPDNLPVLIAAGNSEYRQGKLETARQIFLTATQFHPGSAAAFNNLAQTLSDLAQYDAALAAIQRALQIGGPLSPVMQNTLTEIEQKKHAAEAAALK